MSQATATTKVLEQDDRFLDLGFEELDEPIFVPTEIDPGGHHIDGHTRSDSGKDAEE